MWLQPQPTRVTFTVDVIVSHCCGVVTGKTGSGKENRLRSSSQFPIPRRDDQVSAYIRNQTHWHLNTDGFRSLNRLIFFLQLWITAYLMLRSSRSKSGIVDAAFDYIQQTITAVQAQRRHPVMIYVNETHSPFTLAWQTYSSLKTSSSFQWKRALLEMKMRCVIPAGFHHKWLYVISMHSLGKRRAPLFNYGFIFFIFWAGVGVMKTTRVQQSEEGEAGFPEQRSSWWYPIATMPPREPGRQKSAHLCTHKHTLFTIRRYGFSSRSLHNLPELSHSPLCCISISSYSHRNARGSSPY